MSTESMTLSDTKLVTSSLSNMPWQSRPNGSNAVIWRYSQNPIIGRDALPTSSGIFNSAAVPYRDGFAGVFRVDNTSREFRLHVGFSDDGLHWRINEEAIEFKNEVKDVGPFVSGYDPRVVWIEDRFYVTWCNEYHGPTIGIAWTHDFETFHQLENAFLPYNRNGVFFPRKIDGRYAMLSRPSDTSHTPFGDIFYSESPDLTFWGKHRYVMGKRRGWESLKIGPGPAPIETKEGWLIFTHGVWQSCNGYVYSMGAILTDLEKPWKVLMRPKPYLLNPSELYECVGAVPNVIFPCATIADADSGRIAIYYGAADSVVSMAFTQVDDLLDWMKENSEV